VKHIDLSQATDDKLCREGTLSDESDETCYMVQGIDSLEVHSDTHLDDSASSSCDDNC